MKSLATFIATAIALFTLGQALASAAKGAEAGSYHAGVVRASAPSTTLRVVPLRLAEDPLGACSRPLRSK